MRAQRGCRWQRLWAYWLTRFVRVRCVLKWPWLRDAVSTMTMLMALLAMFSLVCQYSILSLVFFTLFTTAQCNVLHTPASCTRVRHESACERVRVRLHARFSPKVYLQELPALFHRGHPKRRLSQMIAPANVSCSDDDPRVHAHKKNHDRWSRATLKLTCTTPQCTWHVIWDSEVESELDFVQP